MQKILSTFIENMRIINKLSRKDRLKIRKKTGYRISDTNDENYITDIYYGTTIRDSSGVVVLDFSPVCNWWTTMVSHFHSCLNRKFSTEVFISCKPQSKNLNLCDFNSTPQLFPQRTHTSTEYLKNYRSFAESSTLIDIAIQIVDVPLDSGLGWCVRLGVKDDFDTEFFQYCKLVQQLVDVTETTTTMNLN